MRDVENTGERNGAVGPAFIQLDMRLGYRARLGGRRTLDIFYETFNVTDRANFTNPTETAESSPTSPPIIRTSPGAGPDFPRQGQIRAAPGVLTQHR